MATTAASSMAGAERRFPARGEAARGGPHDQVEDEVEDEVAGVDRGRD